MKIGATALKIRPKRKEKKFESDSKFNFALKFLGPRAFFRFAAASAAKRKNFLRMRTRFKRHRNTRLLAIYKLLAKS